MTLTFDGCDWSPIARAFPLADLTLENGIVLRPLTAHDSAALAMILTGDPEMTWTRGVWKQENVDYLLSLRLKHYETYGFGPYAVMIGENLKGMIGVQVWDYQPCSVELLAYVARSEWSRGLATDLGRWVVARCRDLADLQVIYAATREENERSNKLAARLGFVRTGHGQHYGHPAVFWEMQLTAHSAA